MITETWKLPYHRWRGDDSLVAMSLPPLTMTGSSALPRPVCGPGVAHQTVQRGGHHGEAFRGILAPSRAKDEALSPGSTPAFQALNWLVMSNLFSSSPAFLGLTWNSFLKDFIRTYSDLWQSLAEGLPVCKSRLAKQRTCSDKLGKDPQAKITQHHIRNRDQWVLADPRDLPSSKVTSLQKEENEQA